MALPSLSKEVTLSPKQNTSEAFGSILRANLDSMLAWAPIAYNKEDIEGVHQVRVSLRRLRSAVSVFRRAIPREITDPWNGEMRWIASGFGPARDLDVFIDEGLGSMAGHIPLPDGEKKMRELALSYQDAAYVDVRALIDSARYKAFVVEFAQWIDNRGWFQVEMPAETRANLRKSVAKYAKIVLSKRFNKVLQTGANISKKSEDELHQLRIECKKLRYATEFFSALFETDAMTNFVSQLKAVQRLLGTLNDVAVMPGLSKKLLEGVQDRDTLQYAGALLGWRCHQVVDIRAQLLEPWRTFSQTASPWKKR